jgi:hypothetical protein
LVTVAVATEEEADLPNDALTRAWSERLASFAIDATMRFTDAGLVLGAGTVLASTEELAHVPVDHTARLPTLLAAAHLRRPGAAGLAVRSQ